MYLVRAFNYCTIIIVAIAEVSLYMKMCMMLAVRMMLAVTAVYYCVVVATTLGQLVRNSFTLVCKLLATTKINL